jgi:hypothetical protein
MKDVFNNPFGQRGRISNTSELFDRDYEIRVLRSHLSKGTCCQIVGPSGFGKSSLLYLLQDFAREWDENLTVGYLDLQDPRCHSIAGFIEAMWASWNEVPAAGTLAVLSDRIGAWNAQGRRMVLCLDEFQELTRRPAEFTSDFFLDLRAIAQKGMTIVTASHRMLSGLVPSNNPVSPFFNIFAVIRVGPFSNKDAQDFVMRERPGVPPFTVQEKQVILEFSKGRPLALQIACFYVLEGKRSGESLADSMQKASVDMEEQSFSSST